MYLFIDKVMHARTKASEKSSIANENLRIHVSDNGISGRIKKKKINFYHLHLGIIFNKMVFFQLVQLEAKLKWVLSPNWQIVLSN